ncbi:ABC transporter substrate-binding protein [Amorphus orientalis]|uniref:Polar amino acid transport system substrate-binding protein n=1 Tax=Amorphus orientalis TaxID=649198 RepID=A0AAE3VP60_9HYPH|nr:ABC transporter substrate-binding protein [Amorphus orientalis]MDQ0316239.1 polar amino acid transport system substrate-binding protein [Amorphus orientalis]
MTFVRLLASAAIAMAVVAAPAAAKDWETVRIGTEGAYPPFNTLTSSGELEGFDIDIANALCEKMEVKCEFVTQDWEGIITALEAGKYDAIIASMSITDERKERVAFTNKYYNTPPALVVPKGSDITEATAEALSGKTIGAQASTTHAEYAEKLFPDADVKLYPTAEEYKLDLENGRLDGAVDDVIVIDEWVKDSGTCCEIVNTLPIDASIYGEGIGIAIRKEDQDLVEMFNKAIAEIREDGTYKAINDKYFEFDVYGD